MKHIITTITLLALIVVITIFAFKLTGNNNTKTPLRLVPDFSLTTLEGGTITNADYAGKYYLLNVFASWCHTCTIEHPVLKEMSKTLPILGLNWRDKKEKLLPWLEKWGNPYETIAIDNDGSLVIALGVNGLPTSYLISPEGKILYYYPGGLTNEIVESDIWPLLEQ